MTKQHDNPIYMTDAYVHGLLSPEECAYVEQMIREDEIWRLAHEKAVLRFKALHEVPVVEAPADLIERTITDIHNQADSEHRLRWRIGWTVAASIAASILILATLHIHYLNLEPNPYDLRLMGQTDLQGDTSGSIRVVLTDYESGDAVPGVPVKVELHNPRNGDTVQLVSFKTDPTGSGSPRFDLPDWESGDYELKVVARGQAGTEKLMRTVRLTRAWKLMLSTDKPVYQPGQTIHARSLALRKPDLKPVAGEPVEFSVSDPKGNVILRKSGVTSEFGIASTDCALADEILHGPYTIRCKVGDTETASTVEVREYVLPKFQIDVDLDRTYYEPNQVVRGSVDVGYFFGQPVAGAEVEVEIGFNNPVERVIQAPLFLTDARGLGRFEVRLPSKLFGREQDEGDARMTVRIKVTDSAGQSQTRQLSRLVTNRPLRVQVIPENGTLVRGIANRVFIITTYADGQPATTRLAVTGVNREVVTNPLGVATVRLTPSTDKLTLTVSATDDTGLNTQQTKVLKTGTANDDYIIRTGKSVYRGGDTITIEAVGSGSAPIFLDLIKDGQTLLTESIPMVEGQGQYEFDLPAEMSGTIQVVTYRFGSAGLPFRKSRTIYVDQAHTVHITTHTDQPAYRPGETAKLRLTLTETDGSPVRGAISLAAVDESVFSVLPQAPGTEQAFFNLERELLEPVYAIYNWSPTAFPTANEADRRELEAALFASTVDDLTNDREAALQRLVDENFITEDLLDMLDSPYFDQSLERMEGMYSPEVLAILRGEAGSLHSLQARSYPTKAQLITAARRTGLSRVKTAWFIVGAFTVIFVISVLAFRFTRRGGMTLIELLFVISIIALLVGILLPALGAARRTARSAKAMSDARQLAIGLEQMGMDAASSNGVKGERPVRVRQWFPETLLWRPELITDDNGEIQLEVPLADSITTWRLTASAVTANGQLGGETSAVRVFQPFFVDLDLPVSMTRGDEVGVPIVVYNYLDRSQNVLISVTQGDWFEFLGETHFELSLEPNEVRSINCPIRVTRVGDHEIEVRADAEEISDAIRRAIEVRPDGRKVEQVFNGTLDQPAHINLDVPGEAIEGSVVAVVKLHPSSFSQVVEGLDAIFQRPYGCFEQTSSTTYPNVLALDYLRKTKKSAPEIEAKAQQYIPLGYQRLLSFEVSGGGFDWFGNPPSNRTLTAYGLMEFEDMARVHDVDPDLIKRTRDWLMSEKNSDGSWAPESHRMHHDPTNARYRTLSTTAYIAWPVFRNENSDAARTRDYLLGFSAESIEDPYVLALVANALLAIDHSGGDAKPYMDELIRNVTLSDDGKLAWWTQPEGARSQFYGYGRSGEIETTATVLLALIESGSRPDLTRAGLAWLVRHKDALGTWHSTQATVLTLKALVAGTGTQLGDGQRRIVDVEVNGSKVDTFELTAEESDVIRQINVGAYLNPGANTINLREQSGTACGYQVVFRHHVPDAAEPTTPQPLTIDVTYDRSGLQVGDVLAAKATVINNQNTEAPMVILDLPIPTGFVIKRDSLDQAVAKGTIAKYQVTPRSAIVYLRGLRPGAKLELDYRLQATMPVKVTVPAPRAYEYYNPDRKGNGEPESITVRPEA